LNDIMPPTPVWPLRSDHETIDSSLATTGLKAQTSIVRSSLPSMPGTETGPT
jgi:hypothetical protein